MVDAGDHSVGVLIDLDLAVRLKDGDKKLPLKPPPGGTLPFRAIDVLKQEGGPIRTLYYRHDLESFLYTLVWILTYYPMDSSPPALNLSPWYEGHPRGISNYKRGLLADMRQGDGLPYGPLRTLWCEKLAAIFDDGYYKLVRDKTADQETLGGHVDYNIFRSILEENDD